MANEKTKAPTVTLPAPPDDQFYCLLPKILIVTLGSNFGRWTLDLFSLARDHLAMIWGLFEYGARQCGNDGAVTADKDNGADVTPSDAAKQKAITKRIAAIIAGTHGFGHGGGRGSLSHYAKELRILVVAAMIRDLHTKKGAAEKAVVKNIEGAFLKVCNAHARRWSQKSGTSVVGQQVFDLRWPQLCANAESEAKRNIERENEMAFDDDDATMGDQLAQIAAKDKADSQAA